MTRNLATHAATFALAALLTLAMLAGTNALAGHQYRVARTAAQPTQPAQQVATTAHDVVVLGQRVAQI